MPQFHLFKADGTPVRLAMQGWELAVAPAQQSAVAQGHELAHVVQQGAGVRAYGKYAIRKIPGVAKPTGFLPEVNDEVLVAFESGDGRHATLYFNPTEITAPRATQWKVDLGPVARAAYRVRVIRAGLGHLGMVVRLSQDAAGIRNARWVRIL